jgi:hypothetical protein
MSQQDLAKLAKMVASELKSKKVGNTGGEGTITKHNIATVLTQWKTAA